MLFTAFATTKFLVVVKPVMVVSSFDGTAGLGATVLGYSNFWAVATDDIAINTQGKSEMRSE
jgi:hypothetical protein